MNCTTDRSIGYQISTFNVGNIVTPASIPDPHGSGNVYSQLDVTNDTNVDIVVSYSTDGGNTNNFIVPVSVRVKGRRLSAGMIISSTVTVASAVANTSITSGKVTINAGS